MVRTTAVATAIGVQEEATGGWLGVGGESQRVAARDALAPDFRSLGLEQPTSLRRRLCCTCARALICLASTRSLFALLLRLRLLFNTACRAPPQTPHRTMSDSPRPRSRFDRTESDRPPRSRFDRRSRSPASREPDSRRTRTRTRSPGARDGADSQSPAVAEAKKAKAEDAAAKAAAAAARINAQIQAKKGIQHVDVPPIRAVRARPPLAAPLPLIPSQAPSPPVVRSPAVNAERNTSGEIFQQDGDYIKDIEINDLKNRYTLTKGAVQKRVISFCVIH
jgi:hypothetical protein